MLLRRPIIADIAIDRQATLTPRIALIIIRHPMIHQQLLNLLHLRHLRAHDHRRAMQDPEDAIALHLSPDLVHHLIVVLVLVDAIARPLGKDLGPGRANATTVIIHLESNEVS
jgi:hypothetical protein